MAENNLIKKNSIVQVNEKGEEWAGCILQVNDVRSYGIQGYIKMPHTGNSYINLNWDQIEYIGMAVMVPAESNKNIAL